MTPISSPPGNRLRLAILIDNLDLGGAQKLLLVQIDAMAATHDILIVNFGRETPLARTLVEAGAEVVSRRLTRLLDIAALGKLRRELTAWRPDMIHSHLLYAAIVGSVMSRKLGTPHVTTIHNERGEVLGAFNRIKCGLERVALSKGTDVAIACGPRVAQAQRPRVGRTPLVTVQNRVRPIPRLSSQTRKRRREDLGLEADDVVLVAAGRLVKQKGFDLLLDAFAPVAETEAHVVLLLAGDGPERDALAAQAARLGSGLRVRMLGTLEDLEPILALSDALVLSSRHEGLPLVLLEALAAGLPIIATRVGDVETVVDDNSALLVEPMQTEALTRALFQLVNDPELRSRLGEGAQRAGRAQTDVAAFAAELDIVYATARKRHANRS